MRKFLNENNFKDIDFLHNNSYCIENKVIVGTRGWNILDAENNCKMLHRENERLKFSIQDAIKKYGKEKEMIAFLHYPPITSNNNYKEENSNLVETLKEYNINKCYYGHLHGVAHKDAIEGMADGITYKLISADYLNFKLAKI